MKKENPKSKSEDQLSLIQNAENVFDLREKTVDFLEIILSCYLTLNLKQNMVGVSKC